MKQKTILTEQHKAAIIKAHEQNKRFVRKDLAVALGIRSQVLIDYLHKYLTTDNGGFVNDSICPITGF